MRNGNTLIIGCSILHAVHSWVSILGVRIDAVTLTEAVETILTMTGSKTQNHIMTPNPEMLVASHRDPAFRTLLHASALNVPDGIGLLWAAKRTGQPLPERVTGIDLLTTLCASPQAPSVFLLGAAPGVAESAAVRLQRSNPALRIAGTFAGSPRDEDAAEIIKRINDAGAEVLFVAYGAPAQDFWIRKHLTSLPSVRVAMGVGGAFDFLAGVRRRAPGVFRSLGIEWLWRLLQEPRRIRRIITAVLVFPFLVLTERKLPQGSDQRGAAQT